MCYRLECVKECDVTTKKNCLYRLNKKQYEHKIKIRRYTCMDCGQKMVHAWYRGRETMICTHCNHILQELQKAYMS